MSCPSFAHVQPSRARSYEDWLSDFTWDICGDLAYNWIGLFEPDMNYSGPTPVWWPVGVTLTHPRRMLKQDKVILLRHLLHGKLLEHCTRVSLEIEARNIHRLQSSPVHQKTLAKILDAFQDQQTGRNMPMHWNFESPDKATSIRQIVEVNPNPPEYLADLTSDFCVEWQSFSPQGEPLHATAITRCALREGSLLSLEGRTLQQCSVAQEIRTDPRMGNLKLVVAYNPPQPGQFVSTLSYMAFSIRIAVSLSHGRIVTTNARGWEDISGLIAELEAQYLATRSFA
ncbi:hypothetical protein PMG11_04303 [Penicillium brasilianum]|uniref:Uncharacterized protein n=1 Tax=Penicillium brasilianum TaxID=104259 RepID=A0A0F7VHM5_PENBI|nr:hypothetical protein PMG11_04303 [Penicillium brasilianum]